MSLTQFVAQSDGWNHMNGWGGGWMWLWSTAMMAGFVVLVVWLVRAASAASGRETIGRDPANHARTILAERFANGELSGEEYRERLDQLR